MPAVGASPCPVCGREPADLELCCGLCGEVLRRAPGSPAGRAPLAAPMASRSPASPRRAVSARARLAPHLAYLVLGALLAPLFLLPFPNWVGWYFSALVHEMGHAAVAWALGCPALPALGLGEAATLDTGRVLPLALAVWLGAGFVVWRRLEGRVRWAALSLVAAVYPMFAFGTPGELCKLLAGHGAELAFATLAFWRAMTGGFTSSSCERGLYAVLGWYLVADNLQLSLRLAASPSARGDYERSGSFGCVNDYVRVAEGWLGGSLEGVAWLATFPALAVLPLALLLRRQWPGPGPGH